MISNASKMGASPPVIAPSDILKGNPKVNSIFVAQIFEAFYSMNQEDVEKEPENQEKSKP